MIFSPIWKVVEKIQLKKSSLHIFALWVILPDFDFREESSSVDMLSLLLGVLRLLNCEETVGLRWKLWIFSCGLFEKSATLLITLNDGNLGIVPRNPKPKLPLKSILFL